MLVRDSERNSEGVMVREKRERKVKGERRMCV